MNNLEIEMKRAIVQGARRIDDFSGCIPGDSMGFEIGDVFTMPTQLQVFEEMIGSIPNQFIFVETQNGVKRLYPSQLSRKVYVFSTDCNPLGVAYANGSASKLYKMYGTVSEGINALRGRTIKVSKADRVLTMTGDRLTFKTVYTFDLV